VGKIGWNDRLLIQRPRAFVVLHAILKLLATVIGFTASSVCLMAVAGSWIEPLAARVAAGVIPCLVVPGLVAKAVRPKDDPLRALGLSGETYAVMLLGFAVLFVVAAHDYTAPLLVVEGDRNARQRAAPLARIAWFLASTQPPTSPPG
jgi:hypothetical protein